MAHATPSTESEQKRLPGRPREFDRAAAIEAATLVFWRHGYEGASLSQLTEAMGVSRPTLYAAFQDKESLFREVVGAYTAMRDQAYAQLLALPTAREVAEGILRLSVRETCQTNTPAGCLLVQGALVSSAESACVTAELARIRQEGTAQLARRFKRARDEGDLPVDVDPDTLAEYLSSLALGLVVQAAAGSDPRQLRRVVELTIANWPGRRV